MIGVEVSAKNFKSICLMLGYRRQKVRVIPTEAVRLTNLNWDGGTKNTYHSCDLVTGLVKSGAHLGQPHPWDNENEGARVAIPTNMAVIRTGFFMGKESLMEIYVRPENMPSLLEKA